MPCYRYHDRIKIMVISDSTVIGQKYVEPVSLSFKIERAKRLLGFIQASDLCLPNYHKAQADRGIRLVSKGN